MTGIVSVAHCSEFDDDDDDDDDDDVCSKHFLPQEQKDFTNCCPQCLRVICPVRIARNLTTTPKSKDFGRNFGNVLSKD